MFLKLSDLLTISKNLRTKLIDMYKFEDQSQFTPLISLQVLFL